MDMITEENSSTEPVVLHMKGGTGKGSYYEFSKSLESNLNEFYRPKLSQAIANVCCRRKPSVWKSTDDAVGAANCFAIADFGCSCAWNTVNTMHFIVRCVVDQASVLISPPVPANPLHILAFFNDLPSSDFNTLFTLLSSSQLAPQAGLNFIPCGLPGSFYSRLFPPRYLHIGLCTLALHNLSMVPKAVQDRNCPAWNENGIWILEGCKTETAKEYKKQFQKDFTCFLQHRSQELVSGGLLFCVMIASPCKTLHRRHPNKLYENLQMAWRQLVFEGLLEKASLDAFNLPIFLPTVDEVKEVVSCTQLGVEFEVVEVEYVEVERAPMHVWKEYAAADSKTWGNTCETMVRNFVGSLIQPHLGPAKFELLMERFKELAAADDKVYHTSQIGIIVLVLSRC